MHLLEFYYKNIISYDILTKFKYKNIHCIPKLKMITLSFGIKENKFKALLPYIAVLELISGQKTILTISKKSNISLKIRKGDVVGCKMTLRKSNMYGFLSRLILEIIPKLRHLKEFKIKFRKDKLQNSCTFSIEDLLIFSEVEKRYDYFYFIKNLNLSVVSTPCNLEEFKFLLTSFKFRIY